ncbi:D-alanyl-D-alanine carboxypeptidase/D-alanyl-D-alanine endopeptidase [Streptomyces lancefieldiae]|uniref:D-alanyl-D-alanine carboxypeptidase/D-alanyl-D-alanine-endopeptidase n=1 Tax=Streptomyces lancefieldiae TaxID=3075520 RepID=A0ABU3APX8_9ACTN|nr:D-alanyl-D-alanine carboxypeptidase/D-alanyl-D-alanine-endopeptidase [Streptomyces sp. DSM 40712]MDT0612249.1 D-alanyl-D-alanine carboxypeptidase/D-alanyl-D-alanine-endopeptidase [Streptomyces sp. DSM 40712]
MTGTPDETSTNAFLPGGRRRHRKARAGRIGARRALVLAMAVPVASATLAGTSAFAADDSTAKAQGISVDDLDADDAQLVKNLNERVADERLGSNVSGVVIDADSDTALWDHNGSTTLMPASNAKLATATTALTLLGANHEFTTKVVYGDGILTLVGGGDRTLTSDDVAELAKTAGDGLKAAGLTNVKVRVDDSLFADPSLANGWNEGYYPTEVTPVRSLVVDGAAVNDTAINAGNVFAEKLAAQGITVDGDVSRATAKQSDVPVAQHKSAPLSDIVKQMLKTSDNNIAETLLRMSAVELGKPATFEGGVELVRQVLSSYGVSLDNFEMYDGSGLSRADRIPAAALAQLLDAITEAPALSSILDGLPVAGEAGASLGPEWGRFDDANSECAVGKVHAKTGTLTGAVALSGVTQTENGEWRIFSFIENNSSADPSDIKDAMDGLAATVNGCWA